MSKQIFSGQSCFELSCDPDPHLRPLPLRSICINTICVKNSSQDVCSSQEVDAECSNKALCTDRGCQRLAAADFVVPCSIAEDLLRAFSLRRCLTNEAMLLFSRKHCRLESVSINAQPIGLDGLRVLSEHALTDLCLQNLLLPLDNIVSEVLSSDTHTVCQVLRISNCLPAEDNGIEAVRCIAQWFSKLTSLNLSGAHLCNESLTELCKYVSPTVSMLDISDNAITDISSLTYIKGSLRSLIMYNLFSFKQPSVRVLTEELGLLLHLDVSCDSGNQHESSVDEDLIPLPVEKLLRVNDGLKSLVSLDISGRETITARSVRQFLLTHPKVKFLGLMLTPASHSDMFTDEDSEVYHPDITITSLANEALILASIRKYRERHFYVQKSLISLFQMTHDMPDEPRYDLIDALLSVMPLHLDRIAVQLAATACLYNVTKGTVGLKLHTGCLSSVASHVLDCMEKFPINQQLQKNSLLTLCTDKMLIEVKFDRFRCAKLVMECLCQFDEESLIRMCVAIISIIAAKISTNETLQLATDKRYMTRLVEIMRNKATDRATDGIMKFVLSALWNLTDESPAACHFFLQLDGVNLAIQCLKDYSAIEDDNLKVQILTKIVGLLNNVAEVPTLRSSLITAEFLQLMGESLRSSHSEYAYFSAGILANLLTDCSGHWSALMDVKDNVQRLMIEVISTWKQPENAMVAYRCFRPFIPLLSDTSPDAVKLWALWAMEHVCLKDPERYSPLLLSEGVHPVIEGMLNKRTGEQIHALALRLHNFIVQRKHKYVVSNEE